MGSEKPEGVARVGVGAEETVVSAASGFLPLGPRNFILVKTSEIRDAENPALGAKL